ncbi:MAG: ASCH domain-containing protein [Deltaproteobacteria bacterium]|nr:ASCH domain-containing protein [Deltaproteobacteria bacterium]MBW2420502.1 ASCH domain-containing protein [Deltaproteobacteria bacterium]
MTDYPEKTCEIDRLVSQSRLVKASLAGRKTEQRRDGIYAYPGETFELEGTVFEVVSVTRERLGDMGEADARAEGFDSLQQYRDLILRMHRGMEWDEEHRVWVHRFRAR